MMRDAPEMWERRAKQYPLHRQVWVKKQAGRSGISDRYLKFKLWREVGVEIEVPPGADATIPIAGTIDQKKSSNT